MQEEDPDTVPTNMHDQIPSSTVGSSLDGDFIPAIDMAVCIGQTSRVSVVQIHPLPKAARIVKRSNTAKR
jgi:hypothetical protein